MDNSFKSKHGNQVCLIVFYGQSWWQDPPVLHAAESFLKRGFQVEVIHFDSDNKFESIKKYPSIVSHAVHVIHFHGFLRPIQSLISWISFVKTVRRLIKKINPDIVVTYMLHAAAALPRDDGRSYKKLMSIYDIPSLPDTGRLDQHIIKQGWRRINEGNVVWSSDSYKATLTKMYANLTFTPLVCHNCPPSDYYLNVEITPRDKFLRIELQHRGASIGEDGGSIMLRAGAIGEKCGIEETIEAMKILPKDYIFALLGRPSLKYKEKLESLVDESNLSRRVFLWDRPSDSFWKKALLGADIGHLIHGPTFSEVEKRLYDLNSSLSNNRLFQYMAAGLPIITYDDPRLKNIISEVGCFRIASLDNLTSDIHDIWLDLASNSEEREKLGSCGRLHHIEKYCWEKQFDPVLDALIDVDINAVN